MARCKNGRCERPFWATHGRVYCEQCLVLGDDRRDRARLRYRRRLLRSSVAERRTTAEDTWRSWSTNAGADHGASTPPLGLAWSTCGPKRSRGRSWNGGARAPRP